MRTGRHTTDTRTRAVALATRQKAHRPPRANSTTRQRHLPPPHEARDVIEYLSSYAECPLLYSCVVRARAPALVPDKACYCTTSNLLYRPTRCCETYQHRVFVTEAGTARRITRGPPRQRSEAGPSTRSHADLPAATYRKSAAAWARGLLGRACTYGSAHAAHSASRHCGGSARIAQLRNLDSSTRSRSDVSVPSMPVGSSGKGSA